MGVKDGLRTASWASTMVDLLGHLHQLCKKAYCSVPRYGLSPTAAAALMVVQQASTPMAVADAASKRALMSHSLMGALSDSKNPLLRWQGGINLQPTANDHTQLDAVFMMLANTAPGHDRHPIEQALWATMYRYKYKCADCTNSSIPPRREEVAVRRISWLSECLRCPPVSSACVVDVVQVAQQQLAGHRAFHLAGQDIVGRPCAQCGTGRVKLASVEAQPGALLTILVNLEQQEQVMPGNVGATTTTLSFNANGVGGGPSKKWTYDLKAVVCKGTLPGDHYRAGFWSTLVGTDTMWAANVRPGVHGLGGLEKLPVRLVELWKQQQGSKIKQLCRAWANGEESLTGLTTLAIAGPDRLVASTSTRGPPGYTWVEDLESGETGHVKDNMLQSTCWAEVFNPCCFSDRVSEVWLVFGVSATELDNTSKDPTMEQVEGLASLLPQQVDPSNQSNSLATTRVPATGLLPGQVKQYDNMGNYKLEPGFESALFFDGMVPTSYFDPHGVGLVAGTGEALVIRLKRETLATTCKGSMQVSKQWKQLIQNGHVYKAATGTGYDPARSWSTSQWKGPTGGMNKTLQQRCVGSLVCMTGGCPRRLAGMEDHAICFVHRGGQWRCHACHQGNLDGDNPQSGVCVWHCRASGVGMWAVLMVAVSGEWQLRCA